MSWIRAELSMIKTPSCAESLYLACLEPTVRPQQRSHGAPHIAGSRALICLFPIYLSVVTQCMTLKHAFTPGRAKWSIITCCVCAVVCLEHLHRTANNNNTQYSLEHAAALAVTTCRTPCAHQHNCQHSAVRTRAGTLLCP